MAQATFDDFTQITALWHQVARRSQARDAAEPQIFNQLAMALSGRLPRDGSAALAELHALADAIAGRGFLAWDAQAPITGHDPHDRVALTAESFQRLVSACKKTL
ncbi:hypothetical protein NX862_14865 [Rhodobacter sp. KR11]|uniref:hypothetical protein n=1 Tax=Rhodobacter sp. KR11 TaxID=2974588 RepID=UPI002221524B|nr:hypothetical protein [Rhodobacter sp. KR11]MCW1920040.1 hypothetical protein [Rhodobacter sp. KR11]